MDATDYAGDHWNRNSEDILHQKYPLHKACRDGDIESLSLLIVSGQHNPLLEDEFYGWTPAHWAAYFGKLACLRRIVQTLSSEPSSSRYQQTPIHLAAYSGHPQCLHWLLRTGSNPNKKDYLGENAVHKAARTGSMECVGLMAAENSNLLETNNVSLTPSELAARCGYADCSLYLSRAADQQRLKLSGVIHDIQLPVLSTDNVLPGQVPNRCVIIQGLNGGKLPSSIDSFASRTYNNSGCDMEMDTFVHPPTPGAFQANGHQNKVFQANGFHVNEVHQANGLNGFTAPVQKDVTLSTDISQNRVAIAGRKRGREQIDDPCGDSTPDLKRQFHQSQLLNESPLHQNGGSLHQNGGSLHQNGGSLHQNGGSLHQNGISLHQNGLSPHQIGMPNGVATNGVNTGQQDVCMDQTGDAAADVTPGGPVAGSMAPRGGSSVPYVDSESVIQHPAPSFCSHAFYCTHKFKNAPCI